jgi:hypothetical protein
VTAPDSAVWRNVRVTWKADGSITAETLGDDGEVIRLIVLRVPGRAWRKPSDRRRARHARAAR